MSAANKIVAVLGQTKSEHASAKRGCIKLSMLPESTNAFVSWSLITTKMLDLLRTAGTPCKVAVANKGACIAVSDWVWRRL